MRPNIAAKTVHLPTDAKLRGGIGRYLQLEVAIEFVELTNTRGIRIPCSWKQLHVPTFSTHLNKKQNRERCYVCKEKAKNTLDVIVQMQKM
jgi:hypothetical protein